jgi:DNA polymerase-3 subunit beta
MKKANIDLNLVKACALACSKDDYRYYLNGVFIEYDGSALVSVATDGHRLVAFKYDKPQPDEIEKFGVIVPLEIINKIKLNKVGSIAILKHIEGLRWAIEYTLISIEFDAIDGAFPDWRRVVPTSTSGEIAQFDLKYMADFAKICKMLDKYNTHCPIAHNGTGPALVSFGSSFEGFGVLMPVRMEEPLRGAPSWVNRNSIEKATDSHESVAA